MAFKEQKERKHPVPDPCLKGKEGILYKTEQVRTFSISGFIGALISSQRAFQRISYSAVLFFFFSNDIFLIQDFTSSQSLLLSLAAHP